MDEDVVYIHNRILLSHKKEIIPFVTRQMDLEVIVVSEIREIPYYFTYICGI